jgi:hypothetical protein
MQELLLLHHVSTVSDMISGTVPGLEITRSGKDADIRMRNEQWLMEVLNSHWWLLTESLQQLMV